MEKGLFFNSLPDSTSPTGYDRNYNGDDISDWLSVVWENGVVRGGLQINASTNLTVTVGTGRAAIRGKGYVNTSVKPFTLATAPVGASPRYDYFVVKYDNNISVRNIYIEVRSSETIPTIADLVRTDNVYELMLGYVTVNPSATTINQSNITDKRGDTALCPWFTAIKGYDDYYDAIIQKYTDTTTVTSQSTTVTTGLVSSLYNPNSDLASVYINGALVPADDYTLITANNYVVITFDYNILAGQEVTILSERAIDGEGLTTALEQYQTLVQQISSLENANEFNYACNGVNDNVILSTLANTFLSGGTDYAKKTIHVNGTFGMTAPNQGEGTSVSPYKIFNLGLTTTSNRRITFDFSNCTPINPTLIENKYYTIFSGYNVDVKGAVIEAIGSTNYIVVFDAIQGVVNAENCRFKILGLASSYVAKTGTFTNCFSDVTNMTGISAAYMVNANGLVRINGGEHYAYTAGTNLSSVIYVASGQNAVVLNGPNFPVVTRVGFTQRVYVFVEQGSGLCAGDVVISPLESSALNANLKVTTVIPYNKPNMM